MLPDTELICDLQSGLTLCDAGAWHYVFAVQTVLLASLVLVNLMHGFRHRLGWLRTPLWLARRFAIGSLLAGVAPLVTGLVLIRRVREASLDCWHEHALSGCTHTLLDRADELAGVWSWVGWTEALLVVGGGWALLMLVLPRSE